MNKIGLDVEPNLRFSINLTSLLDNLENFPSKTQ